MVDDFFCDPQEIYYYYRYYHYYFVVVVFIFQKQVSFILLAIYLKIDSTLKRNEEILNYMQYNIK